MSRLIDFNFIKNQIDFPIKHLRTRHIKRLLDFPRQQLAGKIIGNLLQSILLIYVCW